MRRFGQMVAITPEGIPALLVGEYKEQVGVLHPMPCSKTKTKYQPYTSQTVVNGFSPSKMLIYQHAFILAYGLAK